MEPDVWRRRRGLWIRLNPISRWRLRGCGLHYVVRSRQRRFWLIRTNSKGALQWNQTLGGADFDEGQSVYVNPSGVYTIVGITTSFGNGSSDGWLIETNVFDQTTPIASVEWSVLQQASIAGIVVLMLVGVAAVLLLAIKKSKRAV